MRSEPLVCVVTPAFNAVAFIRECVESVVHQTYRNWEMIVVDNLSTDGTAEAVAAIAAREPRVRLVRNESFVPMLRNYNNAIASANPSSVYCKVLAADDYLMPECLARMVDLAERNPSVAIVGAYGLTESYVCWTGLEYPGERYSGRELCRKRLLGAPYVFGTQTAVLYRSSLIRSHERFYNEDNLHCDSEVCMRELKSNDFGFVHQILTFQRTRNDSATSYSKRMQTYLPWVLGELITFGPIYLTESELKTRVREHLRKYYLYLSRQWMSGRDDEFWQYHTGQLNKFGLELERSRLLRGVLSHVASWVFNPKATIESLASRSLH